jgi:hypothetical protein
VKRNYLTGLLIVLALGGFGLWLADNTHWEIVEERTPHQGEAVTNPFYSAQHLAESLGAHTRSGHDTLALPSARGIAVLGFWNWELIPERRARLQQWVQNGGRLIVGTSAVSNEAFESWFGVKVLAAPDKGAANNSITCPPATQRLTADPPDVIAASPSLAEHFDICRRYIPPSVLGTTRKYSWRVRDREGGVRALRIPIGRGSVTIVNADAFHNTELLCGDSAVLFAAATQLRRGEEIAFLTDGEGGSLLALLWRYGSPVIALAALLVMLWLWRSGVRFGPLVAATDPARRSLAEQIRGTGQFTLRFGGGMALYSATVRALNESAARRFPHFERLGDEERVAPLASFTGLDSGALAAALNDPAARRPQEIRKTIAFLETARRLLAAPNK